jgi:protein TonB
MSSDRNRAFHYAVLVSITLHALLLSFFPALRDPAMRAVAPSPILARLVEPPAPPPVEAQVAPVMPPLERTKPKARPKPSPPPAVAKSGPAAAPVVEPESEEPAAESAPVTPSVMVRVDPAPVAPSPSVEQADPGSLAQYRLQVISAAPRYKRYPRVARDNNWEGDVVVRMAIGANGTISALAVKKSSGYDVLDQQALEMFSKAAAAVQVPPVLRGKEFAFEVSATYYFTD